MRRRHDRVVVPNPDGGFVTDLTITASSSPVIASVPPSSGPSTGGTAITIAGLVFQPGAALTVGCGTRPAS